MWQADEVAIHFTSQNSERLLCGSQLSIHCRQFSAIWTLQKVADGVASLYVTATN